MKTSPQFDPLAAAGPLLCGFLRGGIVQEHDLDIIETSDGLVELALLAKLIGITGVSCVDEL